MRYDLEATRDRMRLAVGSARNVAVFKGGQGRHQALQPYASPRQVLAELAQRDPQHYPTRERITRALIALHRGHSGSLWSQMLTVAYFPMLLNLRRRSGTAALPADELDQRVLVAFLFALDSAACSPNKRHLALRLRRRTARFLFEELRRVAAASNSTLSLDEPRGSVHQPIDEGPSPLEHLQQRVDADVVLAQIDVLCRSPKSAREVVQATIIDAEPLRSYVARVYRGSVQQRRRIYERLKRQRSRLLRNLRLLPRQALGGIAEPPAAGLPDGDEGKDHLGRPKSTGRRAGPHRSQSARSLGSGTPRARTSARMRRTRSRDCSWG